MSEPMHIISLGAGVQSSTMALMAAAGEITPIPAAAIFADTQAEPKSVYTWLDWLEKQLPFPVHRVTKGSLSDVALQIRPRVKTVGAPYSKSVIPAYIRNSDGSKGIMQRVCTYDFKIMPLLSAQRTLGGIKRGQKSVGVVSWIGISWDERLRQKESREPWVVNRWPLCEMVMTRAKCLEWMSNHGYPAPPRSACVYCPFHSDKEWLRLKTEEPHEFERAVQFEADLQSTKAQTDNMKGVPFLHSSLKPLGEIDFRPDTRQLNMWINACEEGMCGV